MKTLSKSMLVVTGLALSLTACGPGLKGEGTKKTNVARLIKIQDKADAKAVEVLPNIKSISLGEAAEDNFSVTVELANADVAEDKTSVAGSLAAADGKVTELEAVKGKANSYKIKLMCLEDCTMVAAILDIEALKVEATEVAKATDDSKNEDEELFSAQSGTTAPEVKVEAASEGSIRTGVIVSATGEILKKKVLNSALSFEENIEEMRDGDSGVNMKKRLGMIK